MFNFVFGLLSGVIIVSVLAYLFGKTIEKYEGSADKVLMEKKLVRDARFDPDRGAVLEPKSEAVVELEELFERNDREGQDTELKDII